MAWLGNNGPDFDNKPLIQVVPFSGTKNVVKQLVKITQGRARDWDVTWFPELVDKRECLFVCCACAIMCLFIREECQDTFVLGYEQLWRLRQYTS